MNKMEKKKMNLLKCSCVFLGAIALVIFVGIWVMSALSMFDFFNSPSNGESSLVLSEQVNVSGEQTGEKYETKVIIAGTNNTAKKEKKLRKQNLVQEITDKASGRKVALHRDMNNSVGREELDSMFRDFLEEKGMSYDEEIAKHLPSDTLNKPSEDEVIEKEYPQAEKTLIENYDVEEARFTENGEVWIRLDSNDANENSINKMMNEAANLYGDGSSPIKVVVWQGNRTRAVRTFFGPPMF